MQRTQAELKALYQFLINEPSQWFDSTAGHENLQAHAWRAIAYYLSDVEGNAYTRSTNNMLFDFEAS